MKIYLDNCALGRLFDEQDQPRVRAEALAMRSVLDMLDRGHAHWISSTALEAEISRNSDLLRRLDIEVLLLLPIWYFTPRQQFIGERPICNPSD